jgi:hypothetical protein
MGLLDIFKGKDPFLMEQRGDGFFAATAPCQFSDPKLSEKEVLAIRITKSIDPVNFP